MKLCKIASENNTNTYAGVGLGSAIGAIYGANSENSLSVALAKNLRKNKVFRNALGGDSNIEELAKANDINDLQSKLKDLAYQNFKKKDNNPVINKKLVSETEKAIKEFDPNSKYLKALESLKSTHDKKLKVNPQIIGKTLKHIADYALSDVVVDKRAIVRKNVGIDNYAKMLKKAKKYSNKAKLISGVMIGLGSGALIGGGLGKAKDYIDNM